MKIFLSLIASMLLYINVSSQIIAISSTGVVLTPKTDFVKVANGFIGVRFYEKLKGGYLVSHYSISVVLYDNKMNEIKEHKLGNGAFIYAELTPELVQTGNKLWIIYGAQRNYSIGDLYATEIDTETLLPGKTNILATESDISKNGVHRFIIRSSPDNRQHCIAILDEARPIYLISLNNEMIPEWKQKFTLPKLINYDVRDITVLNSGEILISEVTEKGVANFYMFSSKGVMTSKQVTFPDGIPQFISFLPSKNGVTYVAGTLRKNSKNVTTVYLAKLGKNLAFNEMKQLEISAPVLERLEKDNLAKSTGKNVGIEIKVYPQLYEQRDGRIKMIIEAKQYLGPKASTGIGGLVIIDFMAEANNFSIIPRYMFVSRTVERHQNQYIAEARENDILLFYFDHSQNLSRSLAEAQKPLVGGSNAILIAATIDNNSNINRTGILIKERKTYSEIIQEYLVK